MSFHYVALVLSYVLWCTMCRFVLFICAIGNRNDENNGLKNHYFPFCRQTNDHTDEAEHTHNPKMEWFKFEKIQHLLIPSYLNAFFYFTQINHVCLGTSNCDFYKHFQIYHMPKSLTHKTNSKFLSLMNNMQYVSLLICHTMANNSTIDRINSFLRLNSFFLSLFFNSPYNYDSFQVLHYKGVST